MPDLMDAIQQHQQDILARRINAARIKPSVSASICEDCDQPISAQRRVAMPGVIRCISCQLDHEHQSKHFRG